VLLCTPTALAALMLTLQVQGQPQVSGEVPPQQWHQVYPELWVVSPGP
jgi:hypothetical protein